MHSVAPAAHHGRTASLPGVDYRVNVLGGFWAMVNEPEPDRRVRG
jgi:hypothetical protein